MGVSRQVLSTGPQLREHTHFLYRSELPAWVRVRGVGGADESHQDLWPGRGVLRERELGAEPEDGSRSGGDSQGPEVQPQGSRAV